MGFDRRAGRLRALLFLTGAAVAAICLSSPPAARAQGMDPATADDPVTMDDLQQATEPYGDWLDTPSTGGSGGPTSRWWAMTSSPT